MKKFINLTTSVVLLCLLATMACGCSSKSNEEETQAVNESTVTETAIASAVAPSVANTEATTTTTTGEATIATVEETSATTTEAATTSNAITDEMALDAIHTYCVMQNTEFANLSADHWQIISSTDAQVVVLFTSYTGSENRYYVDRASGNTYVTELVPGIIDEEQKTGETLNAKDHLSPEIYR